MRQAAGNRCGCGPLLLSTRKGLCHSQRGVDGGLGAQAVTSSPWVQTNPSLMTPGSLLPEVPESEEVRTGLVRNQVPPPRPSCTFAEQLRGAGDTRQACLPASVTMGPWVSPVNPEPPFSYLKSGDTNTWLARELAWNIR